MTLSRQTKLGLLGVVVSSLALIFIATQINLDLFIQAWSSARYEYLLPCVLFLLLGLITRAWRWQTLLGGALPLRRTFNIMNVAYLVNGVLPLRLGEVARLYLASRATPPVPIPKTASTIIVERLLDLLAVVMMMALAISAGNVPQELRYAGITTAIFASLGFLVLVILASRRAWTQEKAAQWLALIPILRRLPIQTWLSQFLDGLQPITQPRALLSAIWWTALSWVLSTIAGYWLMFAFFDAGDWMTTALYIASAAFAIALPAVPGNVGTYEASILLALQAMGYEFNGNSLAFAVMVHAVNVFVHASTGVVGFIQEGVSLEQLSQGVQQLQPSTLARSSDDI